MLSKFLDPKNDVCFRKIFGTEKNKDILIHFLNDIITFKEKNPVVDVTFLKTVQDPDIAVQKTSIVDVLCRDEVGNQYIVELQVAKEKGFEKRAQYYAAKAYSSQMKVGGVYADLKEIIFIAISDFLMFPEKQAWKSDHIILDRITYENDLKDFSFTFIELPKFKKSLHELSNIIEKWAYFFIHAEETKEEDLKTIIGSDEIIERAYEELNRFAWNEDELLTYEQAEKYAGTYKASMDQKYDEGLEKGKIEGEQIGIVKGEQIGLHKGKVEGELQKGMEIAREMLKLGIEKEIIVQVTGLSLAELDSQPAC